MEGGDIDEERNTNDEWTCSAESCRVFSEGLSEIDSHVLDESPSWKGRIELPAPDDHIVLRAQYSSV